MSKIRFDILTLFPDFFSSPLKTSLLGKAVQNETVDIGIHDIREVTNDPHHTVDDTPYGGGEGMVMRVDVLSAAVEKLTKTSPESYTILLDPSGSKFNQKKAKELSKKKHLILVCGRYEGVDQRFKDLLVDEEISIGDYVLNGGEVASLVLVETISRLVTGFIGKESFSEFEIGQEKKQLLEYPQYTKPLEFRGKKVPEVLLSGDHKKINEWRIGEAIKKTKEKRPDLLF